MGGWGGYCFTDLMATVNECVVLEGAGDGGWGVGDRGWGMGDGGWGVGDGGWGMGGRGWGWGGYCFTDLMANECVVVTCSEGLPTMSYSEH